MCDARDLMSPGWRRIMTSVFGKIDHQVGVEAVRELVGAITAYAL